ncbi:large ribosomal subunit protein eL14 [Metopolophium dirhodum]|uniref:large ribosomal subunit protein eL14 n=1 Tax=Metopolophium dirhodum TaxID=44670 RepID=UPI00298F9398|nr:large ribosomal subunit protein eL14 [Metopolophium dirhodum]
MPFKRFVETGRVVYVVDGPYKGKIVSIVDCIDQKTVLVDGPETGVPRSKMRISQIHLTKFKINFPYNGSTRTVRQAWKKADLNKLWVQTRWAEKAANREKRASLGDFERFKLKRARKIRNKIRTNVYQALFNNTYCPKKKTAVAKVAKA